MVLYYRIENLANLSTERVSDNFPQIRQITFSQLSLSLLHQLVFLTCNFSTTSLNLDLQLTVEFCGSVGLFDNTLVIVKTILT